MSVIVVAEKPAVARDIAAVIGASARAEGCMRGNGHIVTWAIGHLVRLAEPHEINPQWKRWRLHDLPLVPDAFPLVVCAPTKSQFDIVQRLINGADVAYVVCATDAGREGELIFRYIYEAARCIKPVRRLWLSSLTPDAIAKAFGQLRDSRSYDPLAAAAKGRSRADWLVGMNLSRLYSLVHDQDFTVGRVQTPTLAMVVRRELEIRAFVPEDYLEVMATFRGEDAASYQGLYLRPPSTDRKPGDRSRLDAKSDEAARIVSRVKWGKAALESIERVARRIPPPPLYDLTELQRHANRLYGFSAQRTLDIAQALYEKKKVISYPRTDSHHLSVAIAETLPGIVQAIASPYRDLLAPGTGTRNLGKRFVDDSEVSDHHAIIPTTTLAASLAGDERKIYDLVCRRLLAAWHEDHVYGATTALTVVVSEEDATPTRDTFATTGTSVEQVGWKVLDVGGRTGDVPMTLPPGLTKGQPQEVVDATSVAKQTRPPARFTEATLLTAMETSGRQLEGKEITAAMRASGLGTPATRAAILETLFRREYMNRDGKALHATDKGIALVEAVHPGVKSPLMTGEWEAKLARMERGDGDLGTFMSGIEGFVREVVAGAPPSVRSQSSAPPPSGPPSTSLALAGPSLPASRTRAVAQHATSNLEEVLQKVFGFPAFRPFQEEACRAVAEGRDVLLVMPTGAGKSLCYQLPGLARGGTTLVVSPLIALMEDQVAKLHAQGIAADRIHSGRDRAAARDACRAYLDGALDFLFIAPERLKVHGFPEMLARRKPVLIAVDEAHCISHWGHDFRPDYRTLSEHLLRLRPAPIVALTATATPSVQNDIVTQLALRNEARLIHGFRRTNLGIEVVERNPGERTKAVRSLLADRSRRPAILYAATRKRAEELARDLSPAFRVAAYHAGLPAARRDQVQQDFLRGDIEVVVATIAFGMGVDKADVRTVVHTALPATLEGYYQEIGRAGRDGKPSRAVLFYSFVDQKTHEFFHERDYPDVAVLDRMFKALSDQPMPKHALAKRADVADEVFEKALEKLWMHGGVLVSADETLCRGGSSWRGIYEAQSKHRSLQLTKMFRYAETSACRMLRLVQHFGDDRDPGTPCGVCDVCAPSSCIAHAFREPSAGEKNAAALIVDSLRVRDGQSAGQLHRDLFTADVLDRRSFEHVLGGLARGGIVRVEEDSFDKDGATITFQRAYLTARTTSPTALGLMPLGTARTARTRAPRASKDRKKRPRAAPRSAVAKEPRASSALLETLRTWRREEARKKGIPAFRILTDRTLEQIASARPVDETTLLGVAGVGPAIVSKYGRQLLRMLSTKH